MDNSISQLPTRSIDPISDSVSPGRNQSETQKQNGGIVGVLPAYLISTTRNGKPKHTERILSLENSFHIHPVRRRKKIPEFDDGIIFNPSQTGGDITRKLRAMADPGRTHGSLDVTLEFRPLQARTLKFLIVDQFCGHTTGCKDV